MAQESRSAPKSRGIDDRLLAHVAYGLFAFVVVVPNPLTPVAGVIIAYVKANQAADGLASHFRWLIWTFWFCLAGAVIALLLAAVGIGLVLLAAVAVWYIYRVVKGWLRLNDDRAIEAPTALF